MSRKSIHFSKVDLDKLNLTVKGNKGTGTKKIFYIQGLPNISGPASSSIYDAKVKRNEEYPEGKPSLGVVLQMPTDAEVEEEMRVRKSQGLEGLDPRGKCAFRVFLKKLQGKITDTLCANPEVVKEFGNNKADVLRERIQDICLDPDASSNRKCPYPSFSMMINHRLVQGCTYPAHPAPIVQSDYVWEDSDFFSVSLDENGKPVKSLMNYQETPKWEIIKEGTIVQPNFKAVYVSTQNGIVRNRFQLLDALVTRPKVTDGIEDVDVDPALLKQLAVPKPQIQPQAQVQAQVQAQPSQTQEPSAGDKQARPQDQPQAAAGERRSADQDSDNKRPHEDPEQQRFSDYGDDDSEGDDNVEETVIDASHPPPPAEKALPFPMKRDVKK